MRVPGYQLAALAKPQAGVSPPTLQQNHPSTRMALRGTWGRKEEKGWWGPPGPGGVQRRWEEAGVLKVIKGRKAAVTEMATLGKRCRWDLLIPRGTNSPGWTCQGRDPTGSRLAPAEEKEVPGPPTGSGAPASRTGFPFAGLWDPSGRHALAQPDGGLVHVGTKLTSKQLPPRTQVPLSVTHNNPKPPSA